ncbi:hypothetical protein [Burkholderia ambifaria]|uniref:hypothetical protein n=1 Tax=Burkholderia ambifaria TaxID=152480 RepID=UPI0012FE34D9|nr:hypothetical protein [Burkholderia ambifaria]
MNNPMSMRTWRRLKPVESSGDGAKGRPVSHAFSYLRIGRAIGSQPENVPAMVLQRRPEGFRRGDRSPSVPACSAMGIIRCHFDGTR